MWPGSSNPRTSKQADSRIPRIEAGMTIAVHEHGHVQWHRHDPLREGRQAGGWLLRHDPVVCSHLLSDVPDPIAAHQAGFEQGLLADHRQLASIPIPDPGAGPHVEKPAPGSPHLAVDDRPDRFPRPQERQAAAPSARGQAGTVPATAHAVAPYERGPSGSPSTYAARTRSRSRSRSAGASVATYSAPGPSLPT